MGSRAEKARFGSSASPSGGGGPALIPAQRFGKYTLVARLGRGGMAEVFLGFVAGPGGFRKPVVIKRILADLQSDDRLVQMFFDEARLAARLHHPNVVQTYEVGEIDASHFIAMEYLEGQPLHRILRLCAKRRVHMPPSVAVRIAIDALDGLDHAHGLHDFDGTPLGVVHRDVSPQNIFVTYDGVVKVLDFGIAKSLTQVVQTRTGAIKGKYAYISPEQARAGDEIDARADVWALGVVLWESLVGQRLFRGETDVATLDASVRGPIPRLDEALPGAPRQLDLILHRALQRDRDRRYPSATVMKEELEHWLRQEPAPVGRRELARYLSKLFGDAVGEHRRMLSACMQKVDSGEAVLPPVGSDGEPETVPETPPSMGSYSAQGSRSDEEGTPAPRRRVLPAILVLGILISCGLGGGVLAWLLGGPEPVATGGPPADEGRVATAAVAAPLAAAPAADEEAPSPPAPIEEAPSPPAPTEEPGGTEPHLEVAAEQPRAEAPRARRRVGRRAPVTEASGAERTERPADPAPAVAGRGFLTLDTVPWSEVSLDGRLLGTTPLIARELPAGTHVLTLRNPEQGLETRYRVRITDGETTTRRLGL